MNQNEGTKKDHYVEQVCEGVTSETRPGWEQIDYRGTAEALLKSGLVPEFMLAVWPKRVAYGFVDADLQPVERQDGARYWESKRLKGGTYVVRVHKTEAQLEQDRYDRDYPPINDAGDFLKMLGAGIRVVEDLALGLAREAAGGLTRNHKGYHLANHDEITRLTYQLIHALKVGNVKKRETLRLTVVKSG